MTERQTMAQTISLESTLRLHEPDGKGVQPLPPLVPQSAAALDLLQVTLPRTDPLGEIAPTETLALPESVLCVLAIRHKA